MPPNRSDITRDNNPEWRGGNPHYEYLQELIQKRMKTFVVTTSAELTPKDIQDFIWMNVEGEFSVNVVEVTGAEVTTTHTNGEEVIKEGI